MSFPRKLQILIIEDDNEPITGYLKLFETFKERFPHSPLVIARSMTEAKNRIAEPHPYHLVILDLNLPLETREPCPEGIDPGQQLLDLLACRDSYPVPVLLVVTGKLNHIEMGPFVERLRRDFWHGELVNKGMGQNRAIELGIQKAIQYSDVGIHIKDGGRRWFPTLSPREVDMLRRCILAQEHALGVDMEWWSAEEGPTVCNPDPDAGPTKVLMGAFLLDGSVGPSHPTFFKFEPSGNAAYVARDVGIFAQKSSHVIRLYTGCSQIRSLLVTPSATGNRPVSLDAYMQGDPSLIGSSLPALVTDIVAQLDRLCPVTDQQLQANHAFLWKPFLDENHRQQVRRAWDATNVRSIVREGQSTPFSAMERLASDSAVVWVKQRACTHGDLNATNVSIDPRGDGRPRAFIFDPSGVHADHALRDLACLEVTVLLFNADPTERGLLRDCRGFYQDGLAEGGVPIPPTASAYTKNAIELIKAIRTHVASVADPAAYSLLIFDAAMRQLFGLAVRPKRNKVAYPLHACLLASWAAEWATKSSPNLFPAAPETC